MPAPNLNQRPLGEALRRSVQILRAAGDDDAEIVADALVAFCEFGADLRRSLNYDPRDALICACARRFFSGLTCNAAAAEIHRCLARYAASASFRVERNALECPRRHCDRPEEFLWRILKMSERIPGRRQLRRILGRGDGHRSQS